jgi:hypothetical protein
LQHAFSEFDLGLTSNILHRGYTARLFQQNVCRKGAHASTSFLVNNSGHLLLLKGK